MIRVCVIILLLLAGSGCVVENSNGPSSESGYEKPAGAQSIEQRYVLPMNGQPPIHCGVVARVDGWLVCYFQPLDGFGIRLTLEMLDNNLSSQKSLEYEVEIGLIEKLQIYSDEPGELQLVGVLGGSPIGLSYEGQKSFILSVREDGSIEINSNLAGTELESGLLGASGFIDLVLYDADPGEGDMPPMYLMGQYPSPFGAILSNNLGDSVGVVGSIYPSRYQARTWQDHYYVAGFHAPLGKSIWIYDASLNLQALVPLFPEQTGQGQGLGNLALVPRDDRLELFMDDGAGQMAIFYFHENRPLMPELQRSKVDGSFQGAAWLGNAYVFWRDGVGPNQQGIAFATDDYRIYSKFREGGYDLFYPYDGAWFGQWGNSWPSYRLIQNHACILSEDSG